MNYSEELQRLEEKRLKLVKSHSDLLCSFIRDCFLTMVLFVQIELMLLTWKYRRE